MAVLTLGTTPEAKHNLPNQLEGSNFPADFAMLNIPGHGRMFGWGDTLPANGTTGWGKGAIFLDTNGAAADLLVFVNNGTTSSSTFVEVTSPAGTDFGATGLLSDVIAESTSAAGVTADGVLLKDNAVTAPGGIIASGGFSISGRSFHTGGSAAKTATDGTDTVVGANTEINVAEVFVEANATITGVAIFNGPTVTTDKYYICLYDSAGVFLKETATAGVSTAGADVYQLVPFTSTYAIVGPATYFIGVMVNGTTDNHHTHAVGAFATITVAGAVFGTSQAITPPTTFVAGDGPIASLY